MSYVSEIINSSVLENILHVPFELKNRKVEVLIIPVQELNNKNYTNNSLYGILGKYKNSDLIEQEENAWASAVEAKYGNS